MKIRTQLLLMAAAILIPVILAAGLGLQTIREDGRQAALRGLRETARATALIIDREVQGSLSALKALGSSPNLENRDFKAFYEQAAAFNQMPDTWTVLFDDKGAQVVNTAVPYGTTLPPARPARTAMVRDVISSQKTVVTDLRVGAVTGKTITSVNVPASAAGGRSFVVAQVFAVAYWKKKAFEENLPADWFAGVMDRNGRFISRNKNADELLGKLARPELVAAAAASADGLIRHHNLEGVGTYDAYTHSDLTGWTIAVAAPVTSIEAAANSAFWLAVTGMLAAFAVAALAVAAFGRNFIRAIEGASRSASALGRGQQPALERTGIEEVNQLNYALVGAGTLLDIERKSRQAAESERERLLRNETLAREAAQAQNEAKDHFLAMLGHELRNPLAAIAGATALLERTGLDGPGAKRCIEIISRQNLHLNHIVNDLLDISRLMAGKIELEKAPLDMADCVGKCVEALRATELAAGHTITLHASSAGFSGDAVRMDQILSNLLTNALKFSEPGGEVNVTVGKAAGKAVVTVQDAGVGMAPELLSRVFEPFVQGPAPANLLQSGLGIGLALVRQLVRLHGGDVDAASAGINQGSIFSFWVPAIAAQLPESSGPVAGMSKQRKLVYVEDNADARTTMAELLRMSGYEVIEVADGASTLPAVLAAQPDVVIMDIGLPDINGYEVARRLRADPLTRSIALIALTGYGQFRDKQAAELAGFNAHLVKPAALYEIIQSIEEVLAPDEVFEG
jgi:signal transduction histidine kinase/ActR/RegA family two-component response regulator